MGFSIWNYEGLKVWTRPRKVKALCLSKSFRIAYVEQNMCQFLLASICQRTVISWWRVWFSSSSSLRRRRCYIYVHRFAKETRGWLYMEGGRRTPLSVRKKPKRTNRRLVRNVVAYLKSDAYLFAPLFSKFSPLPPQIQMPPPSLKAEVAVKKNKKRLSEKVKEYLNSDCHMYRPMISLPKPGSALKGESFF